MNNLEKFTFIINEVVNEYDVLLTSLTKLSKSNSLKEFQKIDVILAETLDALENKLILFEEIKLDEFTAKEKIKKEKSKTSKKKIKKNSKKI